jgi:1-acyl-sn-glycerol-3-phosphate acyltransferase
MSDTVTVKSWLYWLLFPIHRTFLRIYFSSIVITGHENLPAKGPAILAPKHFSRWDPLVLSLLSTEPLRFMADAKQFSGIQGWMIRRLGAFPVDRDRPSASSFRSAINLLHDGHKLVIFPEGGIVRNQPLREFKAGLARLVLQAEANSTEGISVPIVPISLRYVPDSSARAKISIHICLPLYSRSYQRTSEKQTAQTLTEALYESILEGLKTIS